MPRSLLRSFAVLILLAAPTLTTAQSAAYEIGGDLYLSQSENAVKASRDAFAVGFSTHLSGTVGEDAHAVGFSVEVDADTQGDLYAVGGSVAVRGDVGSDLTATGGTIRTHASSTTSKNARISGGSVTIDGPVEGALIVSGGEVTLNAPIGGDAFVSGGRIRFGPNARVDGRLTYSTGEAMTVPASVADPATVTFQPMDMDRLHGMRDWDWPDGPDVDVGKGAIIGALAATIGSFLLVGSIFLAFAPALVSRLRKRVVAQPGKTALSGLLGLSLVIGSVPILLMTIIGIPLAPVVALAILILWYLGYVLGAYSIGMGVARSLGLDEDPSIPMRLLVLAITALVAALLNFIPLFGWMANLLIVFLGVGAIALAILERWIPDMRMEVPAD